jgi:N-acetylmuramoyl-L-alanine amidase
MRRIPALLAALVWLSACVTDAAPSAAAPSAPAPSSLPSSRPASPASSVGSIEPAPGSDSEVYPPNPAAIVVAIDPGHGGCLDWGVPDPTERGVEWSEKAMTLAIAQRLRDRLAEDGIGVLMIRDADVALAGDEAPDFGCTGPAWRDVDGDGQAGFEETGRIRTRDELQARIDLANLARADVFVSIHINSLTQDGVVFDIAATQTFYDDESPWGSASGALAEALQSAVVGALEPLATYDREDRGTDAVAYYAISREWRDDDTCETPGDTWCKPHRPIAMPGALAEVGSITLREEHDLLASAAGQEAVADGLYAGLRAFLADRPLAGRIGIEGERPGEPREPVPGAGPPYIAAAVGDGVERLRVTNTGTEGWPAGMEVVAGWEVTDLPYLPGAPDGLSAVGDELPALDPGESIVVEVALPTPPDGRAVAWIGLRSGNALLADAGSPALQLLSEPD